MDHPLQGRPNFVLAGNARSGDCALTLSMFAIPIPSGTSSGECRKGFVGNPQALRQRTDVSVHAVEDSPITYSLFDQSIDPGSLTQNQFYGYWARSETCFELHVSSMMCESFAEQAGAMARSVEILDQPDVTLETVMVGKAMDLEPRDWRVHARVGGRYLHDAEPPETARARRFYDNAIRLGGNSIPVVGSWLIQEGIGLSWLMENNGSRALPHLEISSQLTRDHTDEIGSESESYYNLACAHSLMLNFEKACQSLSEVLGGQERKARKKTLAAVQKDPQLAGVLEVECFQRVIDMARRKK